MIEGLENDGLIEAGVQLDVDEGQGYGIARPMPLGDVVAWARDYRLDVDPLVPRTPVGALAAHVAWEHRASALGHHRGGGAVLGLEGCALTSYLRAAGRADIVAVHHEVHAAAVAGRGSDAHRAGWTRLASLVSATAGP